MGPLISRSNSRRSKSWWTTQWKKGATVALGGQAPGDRATSTRPRCSPMCRRTPGFSRKRCSVPSRPSSDSTPKKRGIAAANDTEYGLAAYIFTESLDRALRVAEAVEAGMVGVNRGVISDPAAPFGGVKESGFGREGGFEGIDEYLDVKYIALTK